MTTTQAWEEAKAERREATEKAKVAARSEAVAKARCIVALTRYFSPVTNGHDSGGK